MNISSNVGAYDIAPKRLQNLRKWNLALTVLHAAQAVMIFLMAGSFAITVTSNFPAGPPGTRLEMPSSFFELAIGPAVALFLLMAAVDHLLTATVMRDAYEGDLRRGINRFRWVEYSFSATLMMLLIGMYSGVTDITALVAVIGANVAMILFGWTYFDEYEAVLVWHTCWCCTMDWHLDQRGWCRHCSEFCFRARRARADFLLQFRFESVAAIQGCRQMD